MANQDLGTQVLDIDKLPKRWVNKEQAKLSSPVVKDCNGKAYEGLDLMEILEFGIKPYPCEVQEGEKRYLVPCYA